MNAMRPQTPLSRTVAFIALLALCAFIPFLVALLAAVGAIAWLVDLVQTTALWMQRARGRVDLRAVADLSRVPSLREIEHGLGSPHAEGGRRCGVCGKADQEWPQRVK